MIKVGGFWFTSKFHSVRPKMVVGKGEGKGSSKIVSTNPYRVEPHFHGIDELIIMYKLDPIRSGGKVKLTSPLTLRAFHFGQGWRKYLRIVPLYLFYPAAKMSSKKGI